MKKNHNLPACQPDHGKPPRPLELRYADGHPSESRGGSWLHAMLNEDHAAILRRYRILHAEIFLQAVLHPLGNTGRLDERQLADLLVEYKRSVHGPGADFEIANVIGSLFCRIGSYPEAEDEEEPDPDSLISKDVQLFTQLSQLDLVAIDRMVRERMCVA